MVKRFSARCSLVRLIEFKSLQVGHLNYSVIEGLWKCEQYAVMFGCLCKALLREEGATHLQYGETCEFVTFPLVSWVRCGT